MVEERHLPVVLRMTVRATLAEGAFMRVIFPVTGMAVGRGLVRIKRALVAVCARCRSVPSR